MTQKFIFFNNFRVLKQADDETRKSSQGLDKNFSKVNENLNNLKRNSARKLKFWRKTKTKQMLEIEELIQEIKSITNMLGQA